MPLYVIITLFKKWLGEECQGRKEGQKMNIHFF